MNALVYVVVRSVDQELRFDGGLVGCGNTREVLDFSGTSLAVKALRVAFFAGLEVGLDIDLVEVLAGLAASGDLPPMSSEKLEIVAHNITVLGHMWTFRRWYLARHYSIDDYIRVQSEFIIGMVAKQQ